MLCAKLILQPGGPIEGEIRLPKGRILIGRNPASDIVLDHPSISSRHCEFKSEGDRVTLQDLNSTNGCFIDGKRVTEAVLNDGQVLRLGAITMSFELSGSRVAIPELAAPSQPGSVIFADGTHSCLNHSDVLGQFECGRCGQLFCERCVRTLPRISGGVLRFCPACPNAQCQPVAQSVRAGRKGRLRNWIRRKLRL
jgi:hypothetical protein